MSSGVALSAAPARPDTLRMLCIANSFTVDAVEQNLHEIEVESLPQDLPEEIIVDVTGMNLGDMIHVGDIPMPEGVTAVTHADIVVFTEVDENAAVAAEEAAESAAAAEGGEEAAEPEVIAEKKTEERAAARDDRKKAE